MTLDRYMARRRWWETLMVLGFVAVMFLTSLGVVLIDRERLELGGVAHSGQLEELGAVERPATQDHLTGLRDLPVPSAHGVLDARGACAVEEDSRDHRAGLHFEVGA